jgi:hypothetical protein
VPVLGRRGAAPTSYIGVVGVLSIPGACCAAKPGDDGGTTNCADEDGVRRCVSRLVALVEADSAEEEEDTELASEGAVALLRISACCTSGTGTGARSPPSTG